MRLISVCSGLVCWIAVGAVAEELPKVRIAKIAPPATVAVELAKSLSQDAFVVESAGKTLATFWLRSGIPFEQTPSALSYASLKEGTFVGVVEIKTEEWTDFRKQSFKPGVFTLRIGFQPKDGNHMGVSPSSEFLCLAAVDKDLKLPAIEHKELMKLSKTALGTGHPVVLYLNPFPEKFAGKLPSVVQNELMHTVLQIPSKAELPGAKVVDFPIGIVIVGQTTAD